MDAKILADIVTDLERDTEWKFGTFFSNTGPWLNGVMCDTPLAPNHYERKGCVRLELKCDLKTAWGTRKQQAALYEGGTVRHAWPIDFLTALHEHTTGERRIAAFDDPTARIVALGSSYEVTNYPDLDDGKHILCARPGDKSFYLEPLHHPDTWERTTLNNYLLLVGVGPR